MKKRTLAGSPVITVRQMVSESTKLLFINTTNLCVYRINMMSGVELLDLGLYVHHLVSQQNTVKP